METAGFKWAPETVPMEYAAATMDKPNAKAIPKCPSPSVPFPKTTAPVPIKTSINVPITSAKNFFIIKFPFLKLLSSLSKINSCLKKYAQTPLHTKKKPSEDDFS